MNTQIDFAKENKLITVRTFLNNVANLQDKLTPEPFVLAAVSTQSSHFVSNNVYLKERVETGIFLTFISVVKTLFGKGVRG